MVRIWDVELKKMRWPLLLLGHTVTRLISSVACSPDSKHIVSGSHDSTIRIWDANNQWMVGGPLLGCRRAIKSVAFALDGKRIVSGSDDESLRIWDVEMQKMVGRPLLGHEYAVTSVA